jgi:peptide-methionine (S)-S-oxide reductase
MAQLTQRTAVKRRIMLKRAEEKAERSAVRPDRRDLTNRYARWVLSLGLLLGGILTGPAQIKPMETTTNQTETATLGGGCFWCTEAVFQMLPGVKSVTSGYAGGTKVNPTYQNVCSGATGHAEVIQIEFDPAIVSYDKILSSFWDAHDPTTLNSQGADHGTQYRSIILYNSDAQKLAAEKSKAEAQKHFSKPIVTEIVPLKVFYKAEGYHQDYFRSNPDQPYCRYVIQPKVEKFEKKLHEQH